MYCSLCGNQIKENEATCPSCGQRNTHVKTQGTRSQSDIQQTNTSKDVSQPKVNTNQWVSFSVDNASFGYTLLGFFVPIIGVIMCFVWAGDYPLRAKSCIRGALVGIVVWIGFSFILY